MTIHRLFKYLRTSPRIYLRRINRNVPFFRTFFVYWLVLVKRIKGIKKNPEVKLDNLQTAE